MWLGYGINEYGTKVSNHVCVMCGGLFTVCPSIRSDQPNWDGCLAEDCGSYDPSRDVDLMFERGQARLKRDEGDGEQERGE